MSTTADTTREFERIENDIARTRASLNRRIQELEQRLSPTERLAQVKSSLDPRRLDPRLHPEWLAVGAIALGSALAFAGWRRSRTAVLDEGDLEEVVIFDPCDDGELLG
jgi:hypothetical protein